jgi:putative Mg2+ transporter-C (MgtC) family protein
MTFAAQLSLLVPLVVAAGLGLVLGLERTLAGKHAGMRTYAMVSLGSALFSLVGVLASYQLAVFSGINPLQIAASIVIGIGFIGTGLAAFRGDHPVELTTASGIWVASAIGMACGFGMYTLAVGTTIIAVVILSVLLRIENGLRRKYDIRD